MMPETERTLEERVNDLEKLVDSQQEAINGKISDILEILFGKETSKE